MASERLKTSQLWLIPYENPLDRLKGREFFSKIPRSPGVYQFVNDEREVIYVGKAKDLRARLNSYRLAKPDSVSRKVIRMINQTCEIRWECLGSEKDALLRENELIRELRPQHNVVNTNPESYFFIGLKTWPGFARFRITAEEKPKGDLLFGAFKGRAQVKAGYSAMLRLIWACFNEKERYFVPARLSRRSPPYLYTSPLRDEWAPSLKHFMNGSSEKFLLELTESLLGNPQIPRFAYHAIQDDIEIVRGFYLAILRRNYELKRHHGLRRKLIPQLELDDLLVRELARIGKITG